MAAPPNSWTEWADIFCGHSWVAGGCYRLKKTKKMFFQIFFSRATPGLLASFIYSYNLIIFFSALLSGCYN